MYLCIKISDYEIQNQERDQADSTNFRQVQGRSRTLPDHREQTNHQGNGAAHQFQRRQHHRRPDECGRSRKRSSARRRQGASAGLGPDETRNRERKGR